MLARQRLLVVALARHISTDITRPTRRVPHTCAAARGVQAILLFLHLNIETRQAGGIGHEPGKSADFEHE